MADYGAELAGVRRLLPELAITVGTAPSEGDVAAWIIEFTGEVARRLGDLSARLTTAEEIAEVELAARRLVHYAVAATTWDAAYPERSGDDRRYGAVLWERYTAGLTALADELDADAAAEGSLVEAVAPVYSFPTPAFPDEFAF